MHNLPCLSRCVWAHKRTHHSIRDEEKMERSAGVERRMMSGETELGEAYQSMRCPKIPHHDNHLSYLLASRFLALPLGPHAVCIEMLQEGPRSAASAATGSARQRSVGM